MMDPYLDCFWMGGDHAGKTNYVIEGWSFEPDNINLT